MKILHDKQMKMQKLNIFMWTFNIDDQKKKANNIGKLVKNIFYTQHETDETE